MQAETLSTQHSTEPPLDERASLRSAWDSFYVRVASVLFALLMAVLLLELSLLRTFWPRFWEESEQLLHWELAQVLVNRFAPLPGQPLEPAEVERFFADFKELFPRFNFFLLDAEGVVRLADSRIGIGERVPLSQIERFIDQSGSMQAPLYELDPVSKRLVIFSAAAFHAEHAEHFLYVTLSAADDGWLSLIGGAEYLLRSSIIALLLTFLVTLIAGLAVFALLTRRLGAMAEAVDAFTTGNLNYRIADASPDEVGQLGRAFNFMADTIADSINALRSADEHRRELLANISHDLRSPLTAAKGSMEVLLSEQLEPQEERRLLRRVHGTTRYLSHLVDELSALAELEAAAEALTFTPLSLTELGERCLEKFAPLAAEKKVTLALDAPGDLPEAFGNFHLLERVLSNLVENAIRYNRTGGSVHVAIAPQKDTLAVSVADDGPGIAAEELPYIFNRLFRARNSVGGGSGLGLAIVKSALEAHGQTIEVESIRDMGTRFSFVLPRADSQQ